MIPSKAIHPTPSPSCRGATRVLLILCLGLWVFHSGLWGRSADGSLTLNEILDRHIEAFGGRPSLAAITSLTQRGLITGSEGERRITLVRKQPDRIRLNISEGSLRLVIGYDGKEVWHYYEQGGRRVSRDGETDPFSVIKRDAPFWFPTLEPDNTNYTFRLLPSETINDRRQHVIEVIWKSLPGTEHYYIDAKTFLLTQRVFTPPDGGEGSSTVTHYSDYHMVQGVPIARLVETIGAEGHASITFSRTESNIGLFDSYFVRPTDISTPPQG